MAGVYVGPGRGRRPFRHRLDRREGIEDGGVRGPFGWGLGEKLEGEVAEGGRGS
jgi:hypothetical protein